uniref:Uncharacterized protein n=1 Tax=Papilio polytes TaxID=76194 RepID=I4DN56_PAPPL|nr:unknown unsecreted protein [Papilio polytes]
MEIKKLIHINCLCVRVGAPRRPRSPRPALSGAVRRCPRAVPALSPPYSSCAFEIHDNFNIHLVFHFLSWPRTDRHRNLPRLGSTNIYDYIFYFTKRMLTF